MHQHNRCSPHRQRQRKKNLFSMKQHTVRMFEHGLSEIERRTKRNIRARGKEKRGRKRERERPKDTEREKAR